MGENSQDRKQGIEPSKILFVCTANVCRSPMAEHLFAREIDKVNLPIKVESRSAGLSAMDGDGASQNSLDACEEIGVDISSHKSSGITRADLQEASAPFVYSNFAGFCFRTQNPCCSGLLFLSGDADTSGTRPFISASHVLNPLPAIEHA